MTHRGRSMLLSVSGLPVLVAGQLIQGFAAHMNHNGWEPFHWIFAALVLFFYLLTFVAAWKTREEVPEE